ncbi:MAG: hypothetical protein LUD47_00550 [Clostridia bacterium]|nr:hypothetical protein [Clostridia bacterium]
MKNYLMKFNKKTNMFNRNDGGEIYFNPLHVTSFACGWYDNPEDNHDVATWIWTTDSDQGIPIKETSEKVNAEFTRALNAMFFELGQILKDASIYDIQHRR